MEPEQQQTASKTHYGGPDVINSGKWFPDEHQRFLEGLALYGNQWEQIANMVYTRDPSQIRSHAQKYFNKLRNDQEKIGNQTVLVRSENQMALTRSQTVIHPQEIIQQPEPTLSVSLQRKMSKGSQSQKKGGKKCLGSHQPETSSKKRKRDPEIPEWINSCEPAETLPSDSLEGSFFMEKIFPKLGSCPLQGFSMFALIEGDRVKTMQQEHIQKYDKRDQPLGFRRK